jgi:poly-beta-1,6-N-acetyl-D-glucosamine synthase
MQDFFRAIFWIIVVILLYIYFIYPLILSLLSFIVSRKKLAKTDHFPKISLIILTGNNNGFLKDKIENCLALEYPREKLEIIVAQYDSAEKTDEIVSNYFSKGVNLFNPVEKKGINNTINFCVADSKGEVIVFTDEKSLFDKFAIKNLARNFADPKTGAVTGSIRMADGKGNRLTAGEDLMEKFKRVVLYGKFVKK